MIDPYQAALAALIVLAGSTVLGTVGFGIAVTTSPLLLLFIEARTVVVMLNTVSVALFILMLFQTRNYLPLREMAPVTAAGVLGVPVGVFVLSSLDGPALRIGIAVIIILTTISLRLRLPAVRISPGLLGPAVGFVVAVLLASLALGGPILVLLLLARNWGSQAIRASLSFYFLLVLTPSIAGYAIAGLFTLERVMLVLIMIPPALLGFSVASVLVRHLNERRFRHGVIAIIMVSSVMVLGREALRIGGGA